MSNGKDDDLNKLLKDEGIYEEVMLGAVKKVSSFIREKKDAMSKRNLDSEMTFHTGTQNIELLTDVITESINDNNTLIRMVDEIIEIADKMIAEDKLKSIIPDGKKMTEEEVMKLTAEEVKTVADVIRDYFRAQKNNCQKMPWLTLMADGRGGYGNGMAYRTGFYQLTQQVLLDLETGELTNFPYDLHRMDDTSEVEPARDSEVVGIGLLLSGYSLVERIADLEKQCTRDDQDYQGYESFKTNVQWRAAYIEKYGLEEGKYTRKCMN